MIPSVSFASEFGSFVGNFDDTVDGIMLTSPSGFSSISHLEVSLAGASDSYFWGYLTCNGTQINYWEFSFNSIGSFVFSSDVEYQCANGGLGLVLYSLPDSYADVSAVWNYQVANFHGFTQGELVISFFLTIFMMAGIFTFTINHFIDR